VIEERLVRTDGDEKFCIATVRAAGRERTRILLRAVVHVEGCPFLVLRGVARHRVVFGTLGSSLSMFRSVMGWKTNGSDDVQRAVKARNGC